VAVVVEVDAGVAAHEQEGIRRDAERPSDDRCVPATDNYLLIQGLVIVTAVFVVIVNGLVDIALAAIDPRVRA